MVVEIGKMLGGWLKTVNQKPASSYATCVMDLESGEVLWLGKGRSKADFARFFEEVEPSFLTSIMAVAMDMNASYHLVVQEKLPAAAIVYDRYHKFCNAGQGQCVE